MKDKYIIIRDYTYGWDFGCWDENRMPMLWDTYDSAFSELEDLDEVVARVRYIDGDIWHITVMEHELEDVNNVTEYKQTLKLYEND